MPANDWIRTAYTVAVNLHRVASTSQQVYQGVRTVGDLAKKGYRAGQRAWRKYEVGGKISSAGQVSWEWTRFVAGQGYLVVKDGVNSGYAVYRERGYDAKVKSLKVRSVESLAGLLDRTPRWVKTAAQIKLGIGGAVSGFLFPNLDAKLLGVGAKANWFFHSSVPPLVLSRLNDLINAIEEVPEDVIDGNDAAVYDRKRRRLRKEMAQVVGAPLLAGFSLGVGVHLLIDSFTPKEIIGFPIEWLLRGGKMLDSVWLFSNGVMCFKVGAEAIMVARTGEADLARLKEWLQRLKTGQVVKADEAGV
ncbi:MAG: hypothetical protein IT210_24870 [Armatimonadetes bacterium]|nr:hypothetical protein [Armatimonadota bacterium]